MPGSNQIEARRFSPCTWPVGAACPPQLCFFLAFGDKRRARLACSGAGERAGGCGMRDRKVSSTDKQVPDCKASAEKRASELDTRKHERVFWVNAMAPRLGVPPPCVVHAPEDSWKWHPAPDAPGGHRLPPDLGQQGSPRFRLPRRWSGCFSGKGEMTLTSNCRAALENVPTLGLPGVRKLFPGDPGAPSSGLHSGQREAGGSGHAHGRPPGPPGPSRYGSHKGSSGPAHEPLVQ